MSKDGIKKLHDAAIVDKNNDIYDPDTNHNTGGSKVVIMRGGKPVLAGSKEAKEAEAEQNKTDDEVVESSTRTTALPDMLGEGTQEEVEVDNTKFLESGKKSNKKPKKINRIEVSNESEAAPVEKRKRGRPRKS